MNKLPYFPLLSGPKMSKYVTKHYVNTILSLKHSQGALLTWLISEYRPDNSFIYSTHLIKKYSQTIIEANKEYNSGKTEPLSHTPSLIRVDFRTLLEKGYVLPTNDKKTFIVNPMLSYDKRTSMKTVREISEMYNRFRNGEFISNIENLGRVLMEMLK